MTTNITNHYWYIEQRPFTYLKVDTDGNSWYVACLKPKIVRCTDIATNRDQYLRLFLDRNGIVMFGDNYE